MKRENSSIQSQDLVEGTVRTGQENEIDLSGHWSLRLDPLDQGVEEEWGELFNGQVNLPGSLQSQGFGDDPDITTPWIGGMRKDELRKSKYDPYRAPGNFKWPFWLQPDKYYQGVAWVRKIISIPDDWGGKHVTLELERPHWETRVWIDSVPAGSNNSLSTPHVYDLSQLLTAGKHVLTIRVDNRMVIDVGHNSHSVSDHTQSNWNGIVGKLSLKARAPVWIEDLQVYPDLKNNAVKVVSRLLSHLQETQNGRLACELLSDGNPVETRLVEDIKIPPGGVTEETVIQLKMPAKTWDEFNPNLYTLKARLETVAGTDDESALFGMREAGVEGSRFILNGHPQFLRGTLESAIFPLTGYPPTDVESWKRIIRICKEHGLNHIRFHSWCPPEAAFTAADELGFYYQVECASWANESVALGDGRPVDQWLYKEGAAITKAYANHPSFLLMAYGNEPGGENKKQYLGDWCIYWREKEPRAIHTGGSGWPQIPENEFHLLPAPRIHQWGAGLNSIINSGVPQTVFDFADTVLDFKDKPIVGHEVGQWCAYPNFEEIEKYTGVLKPRNFEVFLDFLKEKNMLDQAWDFLMASGKLQVLCYKADIEASLRTQGLGGFQLLDLHDFPGQGTALVGVLDPFWDSKPYVSADEYRRFCAPIVPLVRLPKRSFRPSEILSARLELSQFGALDLQNVAITWSLKDRTGQIVKKGTLRKKFLPVGGLHVLGDIEVDFLDLPSPAKYSLEVGVEGIEAVNDWDIWVYPETVGVNFKNIKVVENLDDETLDLLKKGGKVLLAVPPDRVKTDIALGFSPIFWNTAWTRAQPPHTLGVLCDPEHPALARFPTEYHSNWQWSPLIQNAATMELDNLPIELKPIVQVVPDWFSPRKLGLVFEAKVGEGSLVVCSVDLVNNIENRLEERQLRTSLLHYMESAAFQPKVALSVDQIRSLFL